MRIIVYATFRYWDRRTLEFAKKLCNCQNKSGIQKYQNSILSFNQFLS